MEILDESDIDATTLLSDGVTQLFSFGPGLIENGQISVSAGQEVDQSMKSNPRTAIGMISPLHYIFVVSDGRTPASTGLSLIQLAQVMQEQGCVTAYNLDGGGSSTYMTFLFVWPLVLGVIPNSLSLAICHHSHKKFQP